MRFSQKITIGLMLLGLTLISAGGPADTILGVPVAFAQTGGFSGTGKEVFCRNGSRDWGSFISSVISYDDFTEYYKDLFVRYNANMCLYTDIDFLSRQIGKVREQIRKAFLACDSKAQQLKRTYYELQAELFFLRKYIDVGNGQLLVKPEKQVFNELRGYFVINKNFFSEEEVKKLMEKFRKKYEPKVKTYAECKDPTWGALKVKWNELKDNVQSLFGIQQSAENIKRKYDKVANTPVKRSGGMLGGLLDARINGLDPETGFSEINAELQKNYPSGYTFGQLQAAQNIEHKRYTDDFTREYYIGQYEHLYKESSDDMVATMVTYLKTLEQTIRDTYPPINQTFQCTKAVLARAC